MTRTQKTTETTDTTNAPHADGYKRRIVTAYHRRAGEAAHITRVLHVDGIAYLLIADKEGPGGWVGYVRDSSGLVAENVAGCNLASLERYAIDCLGGNI